MKLQPRAGKPQAEGKQVPRLGKNGGPLCTVDGMISTYRQCAEFKARKMAEGVVSVSKIRRWAGN